ncbi:grpE [Symbiodinium sp. CCMP2592]|nr:grpE [Symbiodinium sp. CCMP2592]
MPYGHTSLFWLCQVGWMWLLQVVVGQTLGTAKCAILTHRFLVSWAAWQKVKEARRAKKVDPQSDDSSDSDDGSVVSDMTSGTERSPMMGRQMLPAAP